MPHRRLNFDYFYICRYLQNGGLQCLANVCQDNLKWVEVINCKNIGDEGLLYLQNMPKLQKLKIEDMKSVKNPENVLKNLQTALPNCQIEYNDGKCQE